MTIIYVRNKQFKFFQIDIFLLAHGIILKEITIF